MSLHFDAIDINKVNSFNLKSFINEFEDVDIVPNDKDVDDYYSEYVESHSHTGSYFFVDCASIVNQYKEWFKYMPNTYPLYALNSNPSQGIIKLLSMMPYVGFACNSPKEISTLLNYYVPRSSIIYSNPIKSTLHLRTMYQQQIHITKFDCVEELDKMEDLFDSHFQDIDLLLHIYVDDGSLEHNELPKYGASIEEVEEILLHGLEIHANIVGVSFHLDFSCQSETMFNDAIASVKKVFDLANGLGYHFHVIDLGGGWVSFDSEEDDVNLFALRANSIQNSLKKYNLIENNLLIAEPGRYFSDHCADLCTRIESVQEVNDNYVYKINESLQGAFRRRILSDDYQDEVPEPLSVSSTNSLLSDEDSFAPSYIVGSSTNKHTLLENPISLPKLEIGDWLLFRNMGAYSFSVASKIMKDKEKIVYYVQQDRV
ncbi:hypothetical protein WA158_000058 [Blastocystis sp. Blastoise]